MAAALTEQHMANEQTTDLAQARATIGTLSDQLLQARADLHRLGIADQNRALLYAAVTGALGLGVGALLGVYIIRKGPLR